MCLSTCPPHINMEDPGFIDLMKEYYTVLVQKLFMIAVNDNMEYVHISNKFHSRLLPLKFILTCSLETSKPSKTWTTWRWDGENFVFDKVYLIIIIINTTIASITDRHRHPHHSPFHHQPERSGHWDHPHREHVLMIMIIISSITVSIII